MASADNPNTEVATRDTGTIVLSETGQQFLERFPGLDTNTDVVELLAANLGDLEGEDGLGIRDLERITVLPGGITSWAIPDIEAEDGYKTEREVEAVMLKWDKSRAMWISDEVDDQMPDCWSRDGKAPDPDGLYGANGERADELPLTPIAGAPGQFERLCTHCPMNAFGSSTKPGAKGKKCKESRLLYILQPGEVLPQILSIPPTSLKPLRQFLITMGIKSRLQYTDALLGFKLKEVKGGPGGKYAVLVPQLKRKLEPEERDLVRSAAENLAKMLAEAPPPIVTEMQRSGGDDDLT